MDVLSPPLHTTYDAFLGGRLHLYQPVGGHRIGVDTVLLASSVIPNTGDHILDVGGGVGAIGLLLLTRCHHVPFRITSLDNDPVMTQIACYNAYSAGLSQSCVAHLGDIATYTHYPFDQIVSNPPFYEGTSLPPHPQKAHARHLGKMAFDHWIALCLKRLKPGGVFTFILPTTLLGLFFRGLGTQQGGVTLFPLYPRTGTGAKRIIIRGIKGSKKPSALLPGLVLHETGQHAYTPTAKDILANGYGPLF